MGKVDWTSQGLAELRGQLDWLAARSPSASERLADDVARSARLIAEQPGLGFRTGRPDVRVVLMRRHRYRIVYQPSSGGVTILRFLHPRQSGP